jgi:3-hydroxybutyryl-CoA dehydrogenase
MRRNENILRVGVVGAGTMGRGIAQLAAVGGSQTVVVDADENALAAAAGAIRDSLQGAVARGKLTHDGLESAMARIVFARSLKDLSVCDLVIEAIIEDYTAKAKLFRDLEKVVADRCVLASNTSSLSITELAGAVKHPERVIGLHFFNPVPAMKVVEVIAPPRSDSRVVEDAVVWVKGTGHHPVKAIDSPGFIVNHAGRAYGTEALRILGEGICNPSGIDTIMRGTGLFKMGPFELLDLIGLDVSHKVMESIYEQFYQESKYRPSPLARTRVAAGLLGKKSGRGFYHYCDGKKVEPSPDDGAVCSEGQGARIWIDREHDRDMQSFTKIFGSVTDQFQVQLASDAEAILLFPFGQDLTTHALERGVDPERAVGIDTILEVREVVTVMGTPKTSRRAISAVTESLKVVGRASIYVEDSPGFVAQRILAMIVNIGCDIVQQGVCSPEDLDAAVRLGLGYQFGPLQLGDKIGPDHVVAILDELFKFYGDPRYRVSPWLRRRAALGMGLGEKPLHQGEGP